MGTGKESVDKCLASRQAVASVGLSVEVWVIGTCSVLVERIAWREDQTVVDRGCWPSVQRHSA